MHPTNILKSRAQDMHGLLFLLRNHFGCQDMFQNYSETRLDAILLIRDTLYRHTGGGQL